MAGFKIKYSDENEELANMAKVKEVAITKVIENDDEENIDIEKAIEILDGYDIKVSSITPRSI